MQAVELLAYCQYYAHFLVAMETSECRRTVFMKLNVYKTNKQAAQLQKQQIQERLLSK